MNSDGVLEVYLAQGDAPFGTPFASSSTQNLTTPAKRVEVGATNGITLDATFDDIAVDTGSLPGPSASVTGPQMARVEATAQPIVALAQGQPVSMVQAWGNVPYTLLQQTGVQTRTITYSYDGLQRLTSAQERGATTNSYSYAYDQVGNRTEGGRTYDAANQVVGWNYDAAGNLLNDGTTSYTYDALNRAVTTGSTTNASNADGVLVQQGTTRYVQDLASPLSQILSDGTTSYVYGQERLFGQQSSTRTWYTTDALGSVRQTMNDTGAALGSIAYDPWGQVQSGSVPTFGFTGEVQQGSNVYLRARWYNGRTGTFTSRDSFAGWPAQPYSLHQYQYGLSNPVLLGDPSGRCVIFAGLDTLACAAVWTFIVGVGSYAALNSANHAIQQCGYRACWGSLAPATSFDTTGGSAAGASAPHGAPQPVPTPGPMPLPTGPALGDLRTPPQTTACPLPAVQPGPEALPQTPVVLANPPQTAQGPVVLAIQRDILPDVVRYPVGNLKPQPGSRATAIQRAWREERELVRQTGRGSQDWTQAELQEILRSGQITGYTGHHINNVEDYPDWAGDPRNIIFLANGRVDGPNEHLQANQGHRGNWANSTLGRLIDRQRTMQNRKSP